MQKSLNRRDFMKVAGAAGLASIAFAGGIASPAFASAIPASGNADITELFFYSQSLGRGEFYSTDGLGHISLLSVYSTFPRSFTQILSGNFISSSETFINSMLFYNNVEGTGTFYIPDRKGGLDLLRQHTGWRKTWTHIISGQLVENSLYDSLLFYDANSGVSEFYTTDGAGRIGLLKHDIWGKHWTQIISGPFASNPNNSDTGLFFYDRPHGIGEFYGIDGSGNISLLRRHTGLRTSWTTIIYTTIGLLFYDANSGVSEFYTTDGYGNLILIKHDIWSKGWTHIVQGNFIAGTAWGGLLFYNSNTGASAFYSYADASGNISLVHRDTWRKGWSHIVENDPVS